MRATTPHTGRGERKSRASTGEHERTMAGSPGDDVVAAALLEVEDFSVEVEEAATHLGEAA